MKKKAMIVLVTILLLFATLSGCEEKNNGNGNHTTNTTNGNHTGNTINGDSQHNTSENPFLGSWEVIGTSPSYETWTFYANYSTKNYLVQEFEDEMLTSISWFEYIYDETTLCFTTNASPDAPDYFSIRYSYLFSENATRLTLSHNNIVIIDLTKIIPE